MEPRPPGDVLKQFAILDLAMARAGRADTQTGADPGRTLRGLLRVNLCKAADIVW